jgi:hypothetical protein
MIGVAAGLLSAIVFETKFVESWKDRGWKHPLIVVLSLLSERDNAPCSDHPRSLARIAHGSASCFQGFLSAEQQLLIGKQLGVAHLA